MGEEPSHWDRVNVLQLAQGMLAPTGGAVLLFDEMEDMKVFVNRLLETNAVPVIWTTNAIGNVDTAILRRMSFVLKLDLPSPNTARRMPERIAKEERMTEHGAVVALLDCVPEAPAVLRVLPDWRTKRTRRGQSGSCARARVARRGTAVGDRHAGRSQFVRDAAAARASGRLTGCRKCGHVLLFDEVDSLLFDRIGTTHSWEASQVNEMLTWLGRYPLPVIAVTNLRASAGSGSATPVRVQDRASHRWAASARR